ncbi:hypothetical protein [Nostoc sp. CCY 9925]|uniref:hypothetical protein n=1 Tax=Nostoc sp. CCY 9925 TaxID=3103865 RepID=UPI0039C648BF
MTTVQRKVAQLCYPTNLCTSIVWRQQHPRYLSKCLKCEIVLAIASLIKLLLLALIHASRMWEILW